MMFSQTEALMNPEMISMDVGASTLNPFTSVQVPERKRRKRAVQPKKQPQKPAGKKRKAHSEESVVLDVDALYSKSSAELDSLLDSLSQQGTLKQEDEKLLKKIKRQVKNRESAHISRVRHRDRMELLEAEVQHGQMVSSKLRQYVNKLKAVLEDNGIEAPPEPEIPEFVPPPPTELSLVEPARTIMRPLRTAGFCLVMFVVSVGIVFNLMHHLAPANPVVSVNNGGEGSSNSLVAVSAPAAERNARVMAEANAPLSKLPEAKSSETAQASQPIDVIRKSAYLSYDTDKEDSSLALVIPAPKDDLPEAAPGNALVPHTARPVMPYTTKTIFGSSKPRLADKSWSLDNTSYILVNDASEFVPRSLDFDNVPAHTEPVIGLLIPASSFNIPNLAPDDVVELVCGVRNATLVPRSVLGRSLY